ncbi:hypothetical protein KEM55_008954 [Ascosphaera atra]|nr:hypothetical protein KEM55_008954 [Ascosphaera atra]
MEDPEKIVNGMRVRDRKFVVELIASTRVRLASLRSKMEMQLQQQQQQQQQQQKQQPRRQSSRTGSSA